MRALHWMAPVCLTLGLASGVAQAEQNAVATEEAVPVVLELNRVQQQSQSCRLYLLVRNAGAVHLDRLTLDLVFFDRDEIIDRRFSVEAGPLPGEKTSLKQLDVPDLSCADLGGLLLNDVSTCGAAAEIEGGCLAMVALRNRTDVTFFK